MLFSLTTISAYKAKDSCESHVIFTLGRLEVDRPSRSVGKGNLTPCFIILIFCQPPMPATNAPVLSEKWHCQDSAGGGVEEVLSSCPVSHLSRKRSTFCMRWILVPWLSFHQLEAVSVRWLWVVDNQQLYRPAGLKGWQCHLNVSLFGTIFVNVTKWSYNFRTGCERKECVITITF